jgi:cytochrome P450
VVTRYADVVNVLQNYSALRTPTPEQLSAMGLEHMIPIAQLMVRLMLFMEGAGHTRLRGLCSQAFTPARVEALRVHVQDIANDLLDDVMPKGEMDLIADFAAPLPSIVTAELLGVPTSDHRQLKEWSGDLAEMLGNFQHNPDRSDRVLNTATQMTAYFRDAIREQRVRPREGLLHALLTAKIGDDRLADDEVIASIIVTMVGGQETTMNLIGNGMLSLLRNPDVAADLRNDLSLIPSAVEELLRYESPSQHTARLAHEDIELGGKLIRKRQAVYAVMGAANRDPERFPDPDRIDIRRKENRHVAFGYGAHFCFGAPLARLEGQVAFATLLRRLHNAELKPGAISWRDNLGLRGLNALPLTFSKPSEAKPAN